MISPDVFDSFLSLIDEVVTHYKDHPLFLLSPMMHARLDGLRRMKHIWCVLPRQARKLRKCYQRRVQRRVRRERRRYRQILPPMIEDEWNKHEWGAND